MGGGQVRIVCLGLPDRSDLASRVAESSNLIGSEVEFAIEVSHGGTWTKDQLTGAAH